MNTITDLGIIFDSCLTFKDHIDHIVNKAVRLINRQCKDFQNILVLIKLYCTMIRPVLEYCAVVWNPYYANNVNPIEAVQKNV